jgi:hypothetical protein
MGIPNWIDRIIPAALTEAQVIGGPDIDTDRPVSRQHEIGYMGYYGVPSFLLPKVTVGFADNHRAGDGF